MKNRIWVVADTHCGHDKLVEYCDRPKDHSERISKSLFRMIEYGDVLIHLGDICIGDDLKQHNKYIKPLLCKKWLIKGNHDRKSNTWYLSNGWDMVCDSIQATYFGREICFSHVPKRVGSFDGINIHGHCHNNLRTDDPKMKKLITRDHHRLVKMEHNYEPVLLKSII